MSEVVVEPEPAPPSTAPQLRGLGADALLIIAVFAALGIIGALLWHHAVTLPRYVRTPQGAAMSQLDLSRYFGIDGWFAAIGAGLALVAGAVLARIRGQRALGMVVLVVVGGLVGALVMWQAGLLIGPKDPQAVLRSAALGTSAPVPLDIAIQENSSLQQQVGTHTVLLVWPGAAALGALLVLVFTRPRGTQDALS